MLQAVAAAGAAAAAALDRCCPSITGRTARMTQLLERRQKPAVCNPTAGRCMQPCGIQTDICAVELTDIMHAVLELRCKLLH